MSDLDGKLAALSSAPSKPAPETTAALDAQVTRLGKIDATLAALDKRLATIETQLSAPKNDTRAPQSPDFANTRETADAAARAVVAQGLLSAVQSGAPFAGQVAALRTLGSDNAVLARLSGSAAGLTSVAALRDGFAALKPRLLAKAPADPDATWSQRIVGRLTSLVSIRSDAERAGPSPDAVVSRIDTDLARGDVAGALAEARTLPPADGAVLKDWTDAASKRVTAEADARALLAAALAALSKPKS